MNFLFSKTLWTNVELSLIKICAITFGIITGVYFKNIFEKYLVVLIIVFSVTAVWGVILWAKKMRVYNNSPASS